MQKRPTPSHANRSPDGSLGEWLRFVGALPNDADWIPVWPPDAFAIAAALLRRTGAYVGLVNGTHWRPAPAKARDAATVGTAWRQTLETTLKDGKSSSRLRDACPPESKQWWQQMVQHRAKAFADSTREAGLIAAAVNLCIASDTACDGIGIRVT